MLSAIFAVDFKGQAQCKAISELNASDSSIQPPSFMNHMKEINDKGSSPAQEFDASRTPLNPNPIAGCAALASLMSKCSQGTGLFTRSQGRKSIRTSIRCY